MLEENASWSLWLRSAKGDHVLEVFDGSTGIAIRLTVQILE
jgi:hypothetical protein